ncbi:MAG TPA: hypothetical protein EYG52_16545 [Pseudomonadales bacterium]|nr:hypothetical protein [Gammaproteobacteria bacterium]HIL85108.1 hypothetical protein [Pseudomonadales bacterium]
MTGEMRNLETISTAIETASTGHWVFGTLDTITAISTINRIIETLPADQQDQVRSGLSESLIAVIAQTLLEKNGGDRIPSRKSSCLQVRLQTGKSPGMQLSNDRSLKFVVDKVFLLLSVMKRLRIK